MKIDHVALYVHDLEDAKNFFVKYFQALPSEQYHNPKTDFKSYFLSCDGGARLEIMTRPGLHEQIDTRLRTGFIHLSFRVGNREMVDKLTSRLETDGFEVVSGPRVTGDGYYESQIAGFEGNVIEITE